MKYFRKRKKSRDKSGFLNFHVKERTKFFLASFSESSKNESSQYSLKGKKRKKWKMVEEEKSDSKPSGGDDPSDKPSSSGTVIHGPKMLCPKRIGPGPRIGKIWEIQGRLGPGPKINKNLGPSRTDWFPDLTVRESLIRKGKSVEIGSIKRKLFYQRRWC